jgi:tripartite-type tricarboxylate transporter receptor subunit TctC
LINWHLKEDYGMNERISMKLVLFGLVLAFCLSLTPTVSAQPGEFVKGVLQPLADGFPKRTINLIVVDDPGTRDDLYAKSLQAASKGISPVNITVSCEPSASGGNW